MISIILGILLLSCLVWIGIRSYKEAKAERENEIFSQGALYGYQSAVAQLMNSGENCQPVNVYIENQTMQFVDVSCVSGATG